MKTRWKTSTQKLLINLAEIESQKIEEKKFPSTQTLSNSISLLQFKAPINHLHQASKKSFNRVLDSN